MMSGGVEKRRGVLLFSTLGFEEKFAVRCLMRHMDSASKMVVITAPPVDEHSRSKIEEAFSLLKRVAEEYAEIGVEKLVVGDPLDFWASVREIRGKLYTEMVGHERTVMCLSGGLRALVVEALVAALTLPSDAQVDRVVVEIELENLSGVTSFNVAQVQKLMQLTGPEHRILEFLEEKGPAKLTRIAQELGMARSTAYRVLRRLEGLGLVVREPDGTYMVPGARAPRVEENGG